MLLTDFCCSTLLSTRVFPGTPQALKCFQIARRIQNEGRALNTEIQIASEQTNGKEHGCAHVHLACHYRQLLPETIKGIKI